MVEIAARLTIRCARYTWYVNAMHPDTPTKPTRWHRGRILENVGLALAALGNAAAVLTVALTDPDDYSNLLTTTANTVGIEPPTAVAVVAGLLFAFWTPWFLKLAIEAARDADRSTPGGVLLTIGTVLTALCVFVMSFAKLRLLAIWAGYGVTRVTVAGISISDAEIAAVMVDLAIIIGVLDQPNGSTVPAATVTDPEPTTTPAQKPQRAKVPQRAKANPSASQSWTMPERAAVLVAVISDGVAKKDIGERGGPHVATINRWINQAGGVEAVRADLAGLKLKADVALLDKLRKTTPDKGVTDHVIAK